MKITRTSAVFTLVLSAAALPSLAAPPAPGAVATFELFSDSEASAWNTEGQSKAPTTRGLELDDGTPSCHSIPTGADAADSPQIKITTPTLDKPLAAPLDIDVKFIAAPSAAIRPDTFRVCYVGWMVMDITKRITDRITVSSDGLHVSGAQLPRGHHHLVMLIEDRQGHIGRREANFDIE